MGSNINIAAFSENRGVVIYEKVTTGPLLSQTFPGRTPNLGINDAILKAGNEKKKRCTRINFSVEANRHCRRSSDPANPDSTFRVPSIEATVCAIYLIKTEAFKTMWASGSHCTGQILLRTEKQREIFSPEIFPV